MADARGRKTGEHSSQTVKLLVDAAAMQERLGALEARVLRLEGELAAARRVSPAPPSKRPPPPTAAPAGPPPLPKLTAGAAASPSMSTSPRPAGRKSIVDISEIAELVESMPPPPMRPRK